MPSRFDDGEGPDIKVVVAEYRDAMRKRLRWIGPIIGGFILLILLWMGAYSIEPGEVGVVRTFGKETARSEPGLHFVIPFVQRVDKVNISRINREEVGFRSTPQGPKRVDSEALMLTGDENIIEALMIVQYQISEPSKYLFNLKDPEKSLHIASEVALRGVVGQMRITSSVEELVPSSNPAVRQALEEIEKEAEREKEKAEEEEDGDAEGDDAAQGDAEEDEKPAEEEKKEEEPEETTGAGEIPVVPSTDILTTGREHAQVLIKEKLQELMDLYESGLRITEVKLQDVDAPDEVKDAFHDVVRAREEREQLINQALGYREDRLPKARGEAQKIMRAAEAYKQERVLRSEGEANRFAAILDEYRQAKNVTRERLHLETMERILGRVPKKVIIDGDVAGRALPLLNLDGAVTGGK